MSDILVEFDKYISTNKDVLNVLPINTKKNRKKYIEKVEELEETALKIKKVIWNEIEERYERYIDVAPNPKISELSKNIRSVEEIDLFNELNTPYEKLGFDRITHNLDCFFEGNLDFVNENINAFINKFKDLGIELSEEDFNYSPYTNEYMKVFFEDGITSGDFSSEKLKKAFEKIYWKCPDIVTHIELNMRYLYYINSKKIEKELNSRNEKILSDMNLDKNGLVKNFFEINKELLTLQRTDSKAILDKFLNDEWKIKDFGEKDMSVLYERLSAKNYFSASPKEQEEINDNFVKLLNTLYEYNAYIKYKFIIDDLKEKYKHKDTLQDSYEKKNKELRQKEQELLKENKKYKRNLKMSKKAWLIFIRKKLEKKVYEFPVVSNAKIKELKNLYLELDEEVVNSRIVEFVDDNCTIKYMFKIVISFYTYAYKLAKEYYKDDPDIDIEQELQGLMDFINQPYKVMLNSIKLAEESEITSIIANRYKILNINLEQEDLEENLDTLLEDVGKIVDYYNITKSSLDMDNIAFVEKVKTMIAKNKKQ